MTSSGQLIFVFVLFIIYLLPRVYKNFLLTCIVYLVMVYVDNDHYFKKCASTDSLCKLVNTSFIMIVGIHVIFGILLIIGDIKVWQWVFYIFFLLLWPSNQLELCVYFHLIEKIYFNGSMAPMVDPSCSWKHIYLTKKWISLFRVNRFATWIFVVFGHTKLFHKIRVTLLGWIVAMCSDVYFFKYKKYEKSSKKAKDEDVCDSFDYNNSDRRLITTKSAKFQQSDLWC